MLNIMLVDDEILVRTNIKLMLSNYEDDFAVCGEASSAEEAIALIDNCKPDIILSDMVMPGMNGVDFCKYVNAKDKKVHFVALSNYDDYKLVHDTLKNGGEDYLLKHELTSERLKETLISMKGINDNDYSESKDISGLQEKFVLDLITHLLTSIDEIEYKINALDLRIDKSNIVQILMRVDNYKSVTNENDLERKRAINFSIINISNEILKTYPSGILTHIDGDYYSILLSFANERSQAAIRETIENVIRQISSNLKTYLNIMTSFVVSRKSASITDIPDNYRQAYRILKRDLFAESEIIKYVDDNDETDRIDNIDLVFSKEMEKKLAESFYIPLDSSAGSIEIDEIFARLKKRKIDYKIANNLLLKLLGLFIEVCKINSIDFPSVNTELSAFEQLASMSTLNQAREWFQECFIAINGMLSNSYQGDSEYIRKCLIYIQKNYKEPITLDSAAENIGISKSYLSTLFKEEIGQGYSEYLNVYRINKAKEMLEAEPDLHVVAFATGFQDYSYFFKVFKKITGMTPAEYKNQKNMLH